ncbi:MAG: hypothetical protein SOU94_07050 [Acidaminococcus sp.]|uniref:hypothetical protein n=1 Tax=Acidaminococcus sp. TaxID=1872103 RepID=UPI002A74C3F8|nr:hypothetical protein [Acidaminococcus sp.]MDY2739570.1 hypothetical protein [Acidaminococcus sp.]
MKATLDELLRRKLQSENDRNSFFPIEAPEIGMTFMVQRLSVDKVLDVVNEVSEGNRELKDNYEAIVRLIYDSVPLLHDEKLRADVFEPYDVVALVFGDNIEAIVNFGQAILSKFYMNGTGKKKLKN